MTIAMMVSIVSLKAQYDDVYYDPLKNGGTSVTEVYNEPAKPADNINKQEQPDGANDKYYDNEEDYDDYDYYYSSRIRRFDRPLRGFGYFDDCYVSSYNYDPFWSGTTIYVGFDSYSDYNRWRRWNYGPSFSYGFGYGPSFGWNFGYNNYYSPWNCYSYNPYPPYGNVYYNNYYYGDYGYYGGYYNNGYYNGNNNGGNGNYGSNVYYGPRKGGGALTELKGNPRGLIHSTPSNPRGVTNQTPGVSNNNGRNTSSSLPAGVQNSNPRGNRDVLIDRKPGTDVKPSGNSRPQTQSTRPTGRNNQSDRPQATPQSTRPDNRQQVESPRPGRDNSSVPANTPRTSKDDQSIKRDNVPTDNSRLDRETQRENRLKQIYDSGERPARRESGVNGNSETHSRRREATRTENNRNNRIERSSEKIHTEERQSKNTETSPRENRSENNSNSGSVRSSGENKSSSSERSSSSPSSNGRSGRK